MLEQYLITYILHQHVGYTTRLSPGRGSKEAANNGHSVAFVHSATAAIANGLAAGTGHCCLVLLLLRACY